MNMKLTEDGGDFAPSSRGRHFSDKFVGPMVLSDPEGSPLVAPHYCFPENDCVLSSQPEWKVLKIDELKHHPTSPDWVRNKTSKHVFVWAT